MCWGGKSYYQGGNPISKGRKNLSRMGYANKGDIRRDIVATTDHKLEKQFGQVVLAGQVGIWPAMGVFGRSRKHF
jgi:hypothetical protein